MFWVDIVIVLVLLAFVVSGYKRGFILTAGQLVATVVAFFVARPIAPWLGNLITIFLPHRPGLAQLIGFLIIFFAVERLVELLVRMVNSLLKIVTSLPLISTIDKILGACVGVIVGVMFEGVAFYFILTSRVDATLIGWVNHSVVASYVQAIFQHVFGYFL